MILTIRSTGLNPRHTLDRQRTAVERIFSQTVELGIERSRLRNGAAIANLNTLYFDQPALAAAHSAASSSLNFKELMWQRNRSPNRS